MNYYPYAYSFPPYPVNTPICHCGQPLQADFYNSYRDYSENPYAHQPTIPTNHMGSSRDKGKQPFVINIEEAAKRNNTFRTAIWTGDHLQVTLMSIQVGDSIGLEMHPHTDQFLRIEEGEGRVQMGKSEHQLTFVKRVSADSAVIVPAGMWHNITNTGNIPLKLYSIYSPPEHPFGTVHHTKEEAIAAEHAHFHM